MKIKPYKKAALNIAILTMILSAGLTTTALAAPNFSSDYDLSTELSQSFKERQEKIINTFEANDYDAWKKMIGKNSKISSRVQKADFKLFIAARKAARDGRYTKAIKLTESLKKSLSL